MADKNDNIVIRKLKQMRELLGEKAVETILADAEKREDAAQAVGLEFKEVDGKPQKLSAILAGLDAGLESGSIVDDIEPDKTEEKTPAPAPVPAINTKELSTEIAKAVATATSEAVATQFKEFLAKLDENEKKPDPKAEEIRTKMKENENAQKALKSQLDELLGSQPKNGAGFKASQDATTLLKPEDVAARTGPSPDPINTFVSDFVMGIKPATNGSQP